MSQGTLIPRGLPPSDDPRSEKAPAPQQGRRWRFAWFAGVDLRVLNQVSTEWSYYDTIGVAVLAISCLSGFSASLALGYVLDTPALHLAWFGALWAGLICCIERVILQVPTTRKRSTFAASLLFRAALAALIALLLSEPNVMRLNEPEINAQLNLENREAKQLGRQDARASYKPGLRIARTELRETRGRKGELQHEVKLYRRRHLEAAEMGCGADCVYFAQTALEKESRLRAVEKRNDHRQPELHETIDDLVRAQRKEEHTAEKAIEEGNGFWARVGALSAVVDKHPLMSAELWGLRAFFFLLDLAVLVSLTFYLLRDGPKPYEDLRVALWHQDSLTALKIKEGAGVEGHRIREQAIANKEVNQAKINLQADREILDAGLDGVNRRRATPPISAPNLSSFVRDTRSHENEPVAVSPELRRGGVIGSIGIGAVAILATLWTALTHQAVEGLWLVVVALCGAGLLAAYTRGFRRSSAWGLWAIFTTLIVGLTLPLLILVINL